LSRLGRGPEAPAHGRGKGPARPIELGLYTDATEIGGAEHVLRALLRKLGDEFRITVIGVDGGVVEWLAGARSSAATCLLPPVANKWDVPAILAHVRALRRLRPDVLHANLRHPWSCQYGIVAGLLAPGTKVIAVEHAAIATASRRQRVAKRHTSSRLAAHVTVSDSTARRMEELIGLRPGAVRTIHNGIDPALPRPVPPLAPPPVVGMVSRLSPEKQVDLFVRALVSLPGVQGVIVGDGNERASIEGLVDELGLRARTTLTGWRDDARALVATFDALVVCSQLESCPLAILEAMFAGVPVVATDVGGIPELVQDRETGKLVPVNDPDALVEAIRYVLRPENASRLGRRAQELARRRFTVGRMAREYEALYHSVLG